MLSEVCRSTALVVVGALLQSPGCIGVNACESIFRWGALVHHWAQCFAADHTHSSSMKVAFN